MIILNEKKITHYHQKKKKSCHEKKNDGCLLNKGIVSKIIESFA